MNVSPSGTNRVLHPPARPPAIRTSASWVPAAKARRSNASATFSVYSTVTCGMPPTLPIRARTAPDGARGAVRAVRPGPVWRRRWSQGAVHTWLTSGQQPGKTFLRRCTRPDQRGSAPAPAFTFVKDGVTVTYKAEYIWIDGTAPTAKLRSKTRILADGAELPIWGFDGSSTNQAEGHASDRVLEAGRLLPGPDPRRRRRPRHVRGPQHRRHPARVQHPRRAARGRGAVRRPGVAVRHRAGVHLLQGLAPARLPRGRLPGPAGRLLLRCRRRRDLRPRRSSRSTSTTASPRAWASPASTPRSCPASGSSRSARSARWTSPTTCGSPAGCSTAPPRTSASPRRWTPSPPRATGTARARTPTSPPRQMRESYDAIIEAAESLGRDGKPLEHIKHYGAGVESRLTGAHETAPWNEYSYGVSDRGASVRIPWQVEVDQKGYIEDRRPERERRPVRRHPADRRHLRQRAGEGRPGLRPAGRTAGPGPAPAPRARSRPPIVRPPRGRPRQHGEGALRRDQGFSPSRGDHRGGGSFDGS